MMKFNTDADIFICGDIHINLRKYVEFEKNRVRELGRALQAAIRSSENYPMVILSGDIFDRAKPTYEEVALFYELLGYLEDAGKVFVIAGNHEELGGSKTIFDYLPNYKFTYVKDGTITFNNVHLYLLGHPFIDQLENPAFPYFEENNILISHYRSDIGVAPSEVDNDLVSEKFDLVILSDIHYDFQPYENIVYTSSPYSINFSEKGPIYGFIKLKIHGDTFEYERVGLDLPSKYIIREDSTYIETEDFFRFIINDPKSLYRVKIPYTKLPNTKFYTQLSGMENVSIVLAEEGTEDEAEMNYSDIVDSIQEKTNETLVDVIDRALKSGSDLPEEVLKEGKEFLKSLV